MMPVSGLRLDPLVPVPDHVVVEHADELGHGDAREAALVEELVCDQIKVFSVGTCFCTP